MTTEQDKRDRIPPKLSTVYCAISGVKFFIADSLGFQYVAETNKVHPAFLDADTLRAILKYESNKKLKTEQLYTLDWQDVNLGIESDFIIPKKDQIIAKSYIVGIIFAQLSDLGFSFSRLTGRQTHELNIALCKHRRRAQLLWWARRLCNFPKSRRADKINLSTVYESNQGKQHQAKSWSDNLGVYLSSIIEDDPSKLPRLRGRSQASVTIYDREVAKRARQKRADKPLNGQHVDWGIEKAIQCMATLKAAKVITKRQHLNITAALTYWADRTEETREKLGHRLIELSQAHQLKQDYSTVLERIGYGFVTGEISTIANVANYTLADTFLGNVEYKSRPEKRESLKLMLRRKI
jgi:hypothetical protein